MTAVIPARFLFRWSWPVRRCEDRPADTDEPLRLSERFRCFPLSEVDGVSGFAEWKLAWNRQGFGFSVSVSGKREPLQCQAQMPLVSDGVTIWLDTRSTQTVHRATKYCHQFCFLPTGGGRQKDRPSVTSVPMGRAAEERSIVSAKGTALPLQVWSELRDDGYLLEAWLPAESLVGFDPESHREIGFYCLVRDGELGEQPLTIGREFPFEHDPSLWQMLELVDE